MAEDADVAGRADPAVRARQAESLTRDALVDGGWQVARQRAGGRPAGARRADLVARRAGTAYVVQVKAAAEGRGDRLIPLWAQTCLEVAKIAAEQDAGAYAPLAVVAAPRVRPRVAEQVLQFAAEYAPGVAVGVVDFAGVRRFRGPELSGLDADGEHDPAVRRGARPAAAPSGALFSDLNQWLLKVLLAPELPEHLLAAPRARYRNATQLAGAAGVSVMSAFRCVQQLEAEGYLDPTGSALVVVRRDELFARWQAAAAVRRPREAPMRFLLPGDPQAALRRVVGSGTACLALFAAADALGVGFVDGVPPYVYVPTLGAAGVESAAAPVRRHLVPAERGEAPDLVIRQAPTPRSIFRGAVRARALGGADVSVCDVLQVWLDASTHPARGREQADVIRRRVLAPLLDEHPASR